MPYRNTDYMDMWRNYTGLTGATGATRPTTLAGGSYSAYGTIPQTNTNQSFDMLAGADTGVQPYEMAAMSQEQPFTGGLTRTQVHEQAMISQQSRMLEMRDRQRQFVQQQGGDMYSQAMMAMEQQRALSDTRGLSAGAAVGAEQMLSATQQVALAQIQAMTMDQLMQIDNAAFQDDEYAFAAGQRALGLMEQTDSRYGELQALMAKIEALPEDARNTPEEKALQDQASAVYQSLWGYDPDLWDRTNFEMEFDPVIKQALDDLALPPTSEAARNRQNWIIAIGAGLVVAGVLTAKFGFGFGFMALGKKMIAGGVAAKGAAAAGTAAKGAAAAGTAAKGAAAAGTAAKGAAAAGGAAKVGTTVTISANTVKGITSTAQLSSIAKAVGATTAEISKATTAAQLQTLISAKIGTSTLTIASNTVGTATAQTLTANAAAASSAIAKKTGWEAVKSVAGGTVNTSAVLGLTYFTGSQFYAAHLSQSARYANLPPEQKIQKFESYLANQAELFRASGWDEADIQEKLQEARTGSIPLFNQGG